MIYISVDNDYHGQLALSIISQCGFDRSDVVFLSHVARRNTLVPQSGMQIEELSSHPLCSGGGYKSVRSYIRSFLHQISLAKRFTFKPADTLILITEYQLNNALFAKKMKKAGGRTLLFDEGIGFYFNNSPFHKKHERFRNFFLMQVFNLIFRTMGIPAHACAGQEGMHVRINDRYIDHVFSGMKLPIDRNIPVLGYRTLPDSVRDKDMSESDAIVFFAVNFACFGLESEERSLSRKAIEVLATRFSKVYIKIHPSDWISKNKNFNFYMSLQSDTISIVAQSMSVLETLNEYRPRQVAGTMSTALFEALLQGCQPIFLYHLMPYTKQFGVYEFLLKNLNYNFIRNLGEIGPHYSSNITLQDLTYDQSLPAQINRFLNQSLNNRGA
ncbi:MULTISPECIES: polysialyltransferase family glycosyltransferase [unclassified Polaromonas]|jgi:hypothetical protein|uniref:polysialyltransferase family glycosyltransferase n=1 Tax=unclassified Polaromonas TaxID=2638319 RepID=UPI0025D07A7E|nr:MULTISPECIES: polysialyltransferase family glycosyltransferase [unclassified Polaromonas]HQS39492.1 polysialyltransferase family glycosyltransferase [Polaromonas sp.]HQS88640.1 polysialyltransferase family glycosyltransferase [Polaromonas sp.]HQT07149.1 polysialyltransferase family glycosyltransferase [Polaromonas sp.]